MYLCPVKGLLALGRIVVVMAPAAGVPGNRRTTELSKDSTPYHGPAKGHRPARCGRRHRPQRTVRAHRDTSRTDGENPVVNHAQNNGKRVAQTVTVKQ